MHLDTFYDHRLKKITTIHGSTFYNDSKSTVWQATAQAIQSLPKPIVLFLGGLSKNIDRSPLIEKISEQKNITVFAFGKESDDITQKCIEKNITVFNAPTLEKSFQQCINNIKTPQKILFSPGGSSFDLFENYQKRGEKFEELVIQHKKMSSGKISGRKEAVLKPASRLIKSFVLI